MLILGVETSMHISPDSVRPNTISLDRHSDSPFTRQNDMSRNITGDGKYTTEPADGRFYLLER